MENMDGRKMKIHWLLSGNKPYACKGTAGKISAWIFKLIGNMNQPYCAEGRKLVRWGIDYHKAHPEAVIYGAFKISPTSFRVQCREASTKKLIYLGAWPFGVAAALSEALIGLHGERNGEPALGNYPQVMEILGDFWPGFKQGLEQILVENNDWLSREEYDKWLKALRIAQAERARKATEVRLNPASSRIRIVESRTDEIAKTLLELAKRLSDLDYKLDLLINRNAVHHDSI